MPPPDALTSFTRLRPRLSRIAYRMLGSQAEADDMVQEAWLRWADVIDGQPGYVTMASDGEMQSTALAIDNDRIIAI